MLGRNSDVELRWAWNGHEKSDFNEFSLWAQNLLEMVKNPIQAFESLNSDVRGRS